MSLKKILVKSSTRMSLHERFTFLRSQSAPEPQTQQVHVQAVRRGLFSDQGSVRYRRLTEMMDRRPTVIAALRLKKRILKQRLGQAGQRPGVSVKDRLSLRGRGLRGRMGQRVGNVMNRSPLLRQTRGRGNRRAGRGGGLSRSQSVSNLSRSQSMQSLNGRQNFRGRYQNRNTFNRQEFRRGGRGFRARGGGFNRNRDDFRGRRGAGGNRGFNNRGQRSRGFRSRGGGRGRGRGGRRPVPTKEELDNQLDQYMSGSRGVLDQELDSYMNQQESWD